MYASHPLLKFRGVFIEIDTYLGVYLTLGKAISGRRRRVAASLGTYQPQPRQKETDQMKKNNSFATLKFAESTVTIKGAGCLAADSYWKIPITAGQRYIIDATISTSCDSRGWSCDNWATRSGPAGVPGYFVQGSLGWPHAPIGMLIGGIIQVDAGDSMDPTEAQRIFGNNTLLIGTHYEAQSPINGFLYLMFNDTWTWGDNKGSVHVRVIYM